MLFFFSLHINLTINVAHPVFLMHIQSLLSGYAPDIYIYIYKALIVHLLKWYDGTVNKLLKKILKNNHNCIMANNNRNKQKNRLP